MKYLPLIWAGIWRKRMRTLLLLLQITIAFTLFGLLQGMNGALKEAVAKQRADVLYVTSKVSNNPLPLGYLAKLESIAGVRIVNPQNYLFSTYQNPSEEVVAIATDPQRYFAINTYCSVPRVQMDTLARTRTGTIVGAQLARKYGWKIGDRIPLQSSVVRKDGSMLWAFDIVGIYEYPEEPDMATIMIVHNDYFLEARAATTADTVARFVVKVDSAGRAPAVVDMIDNLFANSPNETQTISENESSQSYLQSMGDLDFVAHTITGAAFFALLLSVGTMLMNSIRERTSELGVLKAIGFSDRIIAVTIITEALTICLAASAAGLLLASRIVPFAREYIGVVEMPLVVVGLGMTLAATLALICSWLPVRQAMKLRVTEALAQR